MNVTYKKFTLALALVAAIAFSCSDEDFIEANKNPDVLNEIAPENQFLSATLSIHSQDFEAYYDFYRRIMPWMQYVAPLNGNGLNFTDNVANFSNRYGRLYTGVGDALTDLEQIVSNLPAEEQARYVHMVNIAQILKAYYTFYVSDIYGSIPYNDAWQARYGGTLQPAYDDQQTIFTTLDGEIEQAINNLKTDQSAPQISLGNFDQYYRGDVSAWIKAGNALRLKIAMRMIKRDPGYVQTIAQEVLSMPADELMTDNSDSWVFRANGAFVGGGNWNPDALYATKPLVDFMWDKEDPRLDAFVSPNGYSQDTINVLIAQGDLEAGTTEPSRRYLGSFTSPDAALASANQEYFTPRTASVEGNNRRIDTLSLIQRRLFQPTFDEGFGAGDGLVQLPVITYAEFAFIRAQLAAMPGITTGDDAETFYDDAVRSSILWYDLIAREAKLLNYTPVKTEEIDAYLSEPEIAFDPAIALDQIASQAYIHFYKQPAEAWAWWKLTGYPNTSSVVPWTDMQSNGGSMDIPRRAPLPLLNETSANYQNQVAAYSEMAALPGFGEGPADAYGRVWWDMP